MNPDFEILAAKVLAKEASPEEHTKFCGLIAEDPALAKEFDSLQQTVGLVRAFGPLTAALNEPDVPIPHEHRRNFEEAVRRNFTAFPRQVEPRLKTAAKRGSAGRLSPVAHLLVRWFVPVTAVVLMVALVWIAWQRRHLPVRAGNLPDPISYLVVRRDGAQELQRPSGTLVETVAVVRAGSRIQLDEHSNAIAITPDGIIDLSGPIDMLAGDLVRSRSSRRSLLEAPVAPDKLLERFLFGGPAELTNREVLVATRGAPGISLYSPLGSTRSLSPLFLWKNEPGKTYALVVADVLNPAKPSWKVSGVVSPFSFAKMQRDPGDRLAPDGLYRVQITALGDPMSESSFTFRTVETPEASQARARDGTIESIYQLLKSDSGQWGDALAALLTLPEPLASSELALRLRLFIYAQAGYSDDFKATFEAVQAAASRR